LGTDNIYLPDRLKKHSFAASSLARSSFASSSPSSASREKRGCDRRTRQESCAKGSGAELGRLFELFIEKISRLFFKFAYNMGRRANCGSRKEKPAVQTALPCAVNSGHFSNTQFPLDKKSAARVFGFPNKK